MVRIKKSFLKPDGLRFDNIESYKDIKFILPFL